MGYLSQKKHNNRVIIFLQSSIFFVVVATIYSIYQPNFVNSYFNLFHLFCINVALSLYAFSLNKYKISCLFIFCFLVNYTTISSDTNIFFSDKFEGSKNADIIFSNEFNKFIPKENVQKIAAGTLVLAHKYYANYEKWKKDVKLTVININFRNMENKDYKNAFKNLYEFIIQQDSAVIIYGDFGIPAWDKRFRDFIRVSGLNIKNKLIFGDEKGINLFKKPTIYILGFKEMGIKNIDTISKNGKDYFKFNISFNLEQI